MRTTARTTRRLSVPCRLVPIRIVVEPEGDSSMSIMPEPHTNIDPAPPTGHELLFPPLPYDFAARADRASGDIRLQQFVTSATLHKHELRKEVCTQTFGADRYDRLRALAGDIKQHTLDHLDHYLEQFIDTATLAGTQVHFASTAEEANAICVSIARGNQCRLCVKAKSMVTEEIRLVPALEAAGCETVESDLGEYILQLDHDAPSHIVAPMIHKDRSAVARAFQRCLGAPYTEDARELTRIARGVLRDKYRKADLGMSGGNFLVAETGSVVICTNEGNGRLCTSVPPVHIAVVGIEKLVPSFEHLAVLLKLLARSSTGQPLTVYTHVMTGPRRPREQDGPREMHVVLVDNGRSEILRESTREMLRCIRCGACLNACPVYRSIGGHAYGAVYSGPIGAILTPLFRGLANFKDLPHASSLCGACFQACPVKINIPKFLIQLRSEMVRRRISKLSDRLIFGGWGQSLRHPLTYRLGGWVQKNVFRIRARGEGTLQPATDPYASRGWVRTMRGPIAGWTKIRDMPTPPARSFRHWWARRAGSEGPGVRGKKGNDT